MKQERIVIKADPDDAEDFDVSEAALAKANADRATRRGRPAGSDKELISIRLDKDVLERFRAGGPGWQSRVNDALRKAVGR